MAEEEFDSSLPPVDRPRGSFFDSGTFINIMRGVDKGGDGARQTLEEVKELLGVSPRGSAAFFTQEARGRQQALKEEFSPQADLQGAEGAVLGGEIGLAVAVPTFAGKTAPVRAVAGAIAGTTVFNEESNPRATAAQVTFGAVIGKLLGKGPAQQKLDDSIGVKHPLQELDPNAGLNTVNKPSHIGINAEERAVLAQMNARKGPPFVGPPQFRGPPAPNPRPQPKPTLQDLQQGTAGQPRNIPGLPPQIAEELVKRAPRTGIDAARHAQQAGIDAARQAKQAGTKGSFSGVSRPVNTMTKAEQALAKRTQKRMDKTLLELDKQIKAITKTVGRKNANPKTVEKGLEKLKKLEGDQTAARAILRELELRGVGGSKALAKVRAKAALKAAPKAAQAATKVVKKAAPKGRAATATKAGLIKILKKESPHSLKGVKNPLKLKLETLQKMVAAAAKGGVQATKDLVKVFKKGGLTDKQMRKQIEQLTGAKASPKSNTEQLARQLNVARADATQGMTKKQKAALFATLAAGGGAASAAESGSGSQEGAALGLAAAVGMLGVLGGPSLVRAMSKVAKKPPKQVDRNLKAGMREASRAGGDFNKAKSLADRIKDYTPETISNLFIAAGKTLDKYLGSVETRIRLISPKIADALSKMEFRVHAQAGRWLTQSEKSFKALDDAKLTSEQTMTFNIKLNNSRGQAISYLDTIGKREAANEFRALGSTLDDIGEYLKSVGLGSGLRAGYFPRQIDDISQFENITEVTSYLEHLAKVKKIDLTDYEKQNILTDLMNDAVSRSSDQRFGRASKNLLRRHRKVTRDTIAAYADPRQAMNNYAEDIARQVERRKFFEGQNVNVSKLGPQGENIDSIAFTLAKGLGHTITSKQADEIAMLIRGRFGPGEQASSRGVQNFKNFTYAGLLGNPIAAITQLGDVALSAQRNGIRNTVSAVVDQIARKGKLDKGRDLGLRDAAADFASKVASRDILEWSLKYGGFKTMDKFGKNVFINAAMKRNAQMGKTEFIQKWQGRYDPNGGTRATEKLYNDVQNFEKTGLTDANREDIGLMAWNELSGVQPIGVSALPQAFLENPNGRMAYMLQTFTLKLFDVMRKDILQEAAAGNHMMAAKNAAKLTGLFVTLNAGTDAAKNFLTGKSATVPELLVNNFIKMSGANKFMFETAGRQGAGAALSSIVMPPMAMVDALFDPKKAVGLLPVVGRNAQQFLQ